jgi:hypothetical protein
MKRQKRKRSSYLSARYLQLETRPVKIWGYDQSENFVCRLEVNSAGVAVFSGRKGTKKICDLTWEGLIQKLSR